MNQVLITKSQLIKLYEMNHNSSNRQTITEAKWYNTVLGILGIFDPTPTMDLINAFSYWKQGERFLSVMSFLSAIPYGGDLIGKSAMMAAKSGSKSALGLAKATKLLDSDPLKAAEIIKKISKGSDATAKLLRGAKNWGPEVLEKTSKLPNAVGGIKRFIMLFVDFIMKNTRNISSAYKFSDIKIPTRIKTNTVEKSLIDDPLYKFFDLFLSGQLKLQ